MLPFDELVSVKWKMSVASLLLNKNDCIVRLASYCGDFTHRERERERAVRGGPLNGYNWEIWFNNDVDNGSFSAIYGQLMTSNVLLGEYV